MSKKIIIAGGGTGGHIFPAIAIANALKKIDTSIEILFVGAKGKMEMERVPQAGYKIIGIDIAGFNRSSLIKNIGLPFKLIKSFFQVRKIIKQFKPDAVVGVGGVTVVLPSVQVTATAQDASACLCLASAVLSMVLLLDASEAEPELLLAVFLFGLTFVFVIL